MTERPIMAIPRPAVVAALSPFGDRIVRALSRRHELRHGGLPDSCRLLGSTPDATSRLAHALTEALSIRNAPDGLALRDGWPRQRPPLVLAIVAAGELEDLAAIERFAQVARREFQRSCLAGTIGLLVYAGRVGNRAPDDAILAAIEAEEQFHIKLVYTDTDASGWRIGEGDAKAAGALLLTYLLETETLQDRVATLASSQSPGNRLITFGIGRVDLSEAALRRALRRRLQNQAREILFPPVGNAFGSPPAPGAIDLPTLTALQERANGSLWPIEVAARHAADRSADRWLEALLFDVAENTQKALQALIPPPAVPRLSFWQRFWVRLCRLWRGFWRLICFWRQSDDETVSRQVPSARESSASWQTELIAAERPRLQLARLRLALQPNSTDDQDSALDSPFERVLGDQPDLLDQLFARCAPTRGELAWALARALPVTDILNDESRPEVIQARRDEVCDRLLKLDKWPRLLKLEDYRAMLDRMAEAVYPLFCGSGSRVRRLMLLPPRLSQAYEVSGYEKFMGAEEEVVFFVVQTGITVRSLVSDEDHANEHAPCGPAPARR
jgi:hypothetical protein